MLISKFIAQIIAIHILSNISRSRGNQTMKFGHLIEYNVRNIFLEKSFIKCCEETIPRPCSKKSKLSISLDQWSKVLYILFLLYAKLRAIKICWNYAAGHLLLSHIKLLWKTKRGLELVFLPHFCMISEEKYFSRDMCIVITC